MSFKVSSNVSVVLSEMNNIVKQLHFALAAALTKTAAQGSEDVRGEMEADFDRPKSYTLNSVSATRATKAQLSASVFIKDGPVKTYALGVQSDGGARRTKGFEKALRSMGALSSSMFVAPAAGAALDKYGGVVLSQIKEIISDIGMQVDGFVGARGRKAGRKKGRVYFAVPQTRGKLKAGIYLRKGVYIMPIFHYISRPNYKIKFSFSKVMEQSAAKNFPINYEQAIVDAFNSR